MTTLDGLPANVAYPTLATVLSSLNNQLRKGPRSAIDDWPDRARTIVGKLAAADRRALTYDISRLQQAPSEDQNLIMRSLGWQDTFTAASHDSGETVLEVLVLILAHNPE